MRALFQCVSLIVLLRFSGGTTDPRGVDPDYASFYDSAQNFQCLDGSSIIEFKKINDDYCDCLDGSDEPGTSACSNGSFYCRNDGFRPDKIPSSRVNDGICDCCDGADEWESLTCKDVCSEVGARARAEYARRLKVVEVGLQLKEDLINKGQEIHKQKNEELTLKENELHDLKSQIEGLESIKDFKESLEKAALDVYREIEEKERLVKEEEERIKKELEFQDKFNQLDVDSDGKIQASDLQNNIKFDQNNDGIVSEEEGAFYMSGLESYDLESFKLQGWPLMEPVLENKPPPTPTIKPEGVEEESQKEDVDYEDFDEEDDELRPPHLNSNTGEEEEEEDLEVEKEEDPNSKYDVETQRLIDDANKARADYEQVDRKAKDLENDITHIKSVLENDYGPQREFLPLSNECFEFSDQEYVYKMCTFGHCTQMSKNGGSETRLGDWANWSHTYSEMKYEKGTQCWNGPQRSTAVRVTCGVESKLTGVSEPNKCEYVFQFETPAACSPLLREDNSLHDEL